MTLHAAYLATDYVVYCPAPSTVRIGWICPPTISALLMDIPEPGCFITAWNPGSVVKTAAENIVSTDRLKLELSHLNKKIFPACAVPWAPEWQPEDGLFILGIAADLALEIAERFGQNAIVIVYRDRPAALAPTKLWRPDDDIGQCAATIGNKE